MRDNSRVLHRVGEHRVVFTDGETVRSFRLNPLALASLVLMFFLLSAAFIGSAAYLFFRDDLLTAALVRQHRLQVSYEDRISDLRSQIDRIASRQLINQEGFEARIDRLMERQRDILDRRDAVETVLDRAVEAGLSVPAVPAPATRDTLAPERHSSLFISPANAAMPLSSRDPQTLLNSVEQQLLDADAAGINAVQQLMRLARSRTDAIRDEVIALGIQPDTLGTRGAIGGPFEPAHLEPELASTLSEAAAAIDAFVSLRDGLSTLPIGRPVTEARTSSTFGNRADPFTGGRAFHAGLDFAAGSGTEVHATAEGRVVSAGRNGGYGNMVEIDHGHGLTTRYAHLSRILVSEGQRVALGTPIGQVGSTGRSTGPHLHYEVRRNGEAENPARFLRARRTIAAALN